MIVLGMRQAVTVGDAAAMVGVSVRSIRRWVAAGLVSQDARGRVALEDVDAARDRGRARSSDQLVATVQAAARRAARAAAEDVAAVPSGPRPWTGPASSLST